MSPGRCMSATVCRWSPTRCTAALLGKKPRRVLLLRGEALAILQATRLGSSPKGGGMDRLFPNRIHRHALVRLLQPRVLPRDFPAYWDKRLGEDIQDALARFRETGLVAECSLAVKVEHLLNASVIKQMLRERGLKVSGRKDEGAQRQADADPEGVRRSIDP